jgi:hypothetical protein
MTIFIRILICLLGLITASGVFAQTNAEYLVEIDPSNGNFEAMGPPLEDVFLIYVDRQCKDEVNGRYIFVSPMNPNSFVTADISTGEILQTSPYIDNNWAGFHCYHNCDTLISVNLNQITEMHYVSLYDRVNGTELEVIGDSVPDDNDQFWGLSYYYSAFDPNNDLLYLYNWYSAEMRLMSIPSGNISETHLLTSSPDRIVYDEVGDKLYGLRIINYDTKQIYVFNSTIGDFEPIGEPFTTLTNGYTTISINGNDEHMIITTSGSQNGSVVASVSLNTGELIEEYQTIEEPNSSLGGNNTINGLYFNSTDQLISLHWGPGTNLSTLDASQYYSDVTIFPNPNRGRFNFRSDEERHDYYDLTIYDIRGVVVYANKRLQENQELDLGLPVGYYMASFTTPDNKLHRAPFVIH